MISFIVMATLSTAPEMEAGIFNRRSKSCCEAPAAPCCGQAAPAPCAGCGQAAPCTGCGQAAAPCGTPGSPCAPAATTPAAPGGTTPPKTMPAGDMPKADAPKGSGDKAVAPADKKAAEAPIEIPADLKAAIEKSEQKQQILDYVNNLTVPREQRIQYLETVRTTLLGAKK